MKLLNEVNEILGKYTFKEIELPEGYKNVYQYRRDGNSLDSSLTPKLSDGDLVKKYYDNIPNGHYGFSLGDPTPNMWVECIVEILDYLLSHDPNLHICQIKIKYGGVRFYVESSVIEDIFEIERAVENIMFDKKLIY